MCLSFVFIPYFIKVAILGGWEKYIRDFCRWEVETFSAHDVT